MHEGRLLSGRYRLLSKLGQGGMGSVWRAEHVALRTIAAVKLIDPSIAESAEARARFEREAQAAASLRSAHVVQILDYGVDDGLPYIVMELLQGESLADRLERVGRLEPRETAVILAQVAKAMARAHEQHIVHRDLKPDNIFLIRDGDEEIAKVLDFGIAKSRGDGVTNVATQTGTMLGTPYYMSPEQAIGQRAVDHRTDIWAFAVIAYESITGARPFEGETIGGVAVAICVGRIPRPSEVGSVPEGFDEWFARCTDRDPNQRFQSIKDAAVHLQAVCEGGQLPVAQDTGQRLRTGGTSAQSGSVPTPWDRTAVGAPTRLDTDAVFSGTTPGVPLRARASLGMALLGGAVVAVVALGALAFVLMRDTPQPQGVASGQPTSVSSGPVNAREGDNTTEGRGFPAPTPLPAVSLAEPPSASPPPADSQVADAGVSPVDIQRPPPRNRTRSRRPAVSAAPPPAAGKPPPKEPKPKPENLDDLVAL